MNFSINEMKEEGHNHIDSMISQAWAIRFENVDKLKELGEESERKSRKLNYTKGLAYAHLVLAVANFLRSRNKQALDYCLEAMSYFENNPGETGYYSTLTYLSNIYESFGEYETALEYCQTAYKVYQ